PAYQTLLLIQFVALPGIGGGGRFSMSYPGTVIVRVGYMAPRLPYPVNVHLPPTRGPDTRTQIRTVGPDLDIAVPQDSTRHEVLGRFMDAWSSVESTIAMLLSRLAPVNLRDANLIFPKLGGKNALELLEGLGLRKLDEDSADKLQGFLERAGKLNTKRN